MYSLLAAASICDLRLLSICPLQFNGNLNELRSNTISSIDLKHLIWSRFITFDRKRRNLEYILLSINDFYYFHFNVITYKVHYIIQRYCQHLLMTGITDFELEIQMNEAISKKACNRKEGIVKISIKSSHLNFSLVDAR